MTSGAWRDDSIYEHWPIHSGLPHYRFHIEIFLIDFDRTSVKSTSLLHVECHSRKHYMGQLAIDERHAVPMDIFR